MSDSQDIPLGLCQCGCGRETKVAPRTIQAYGYVKGRPRRFLPGHHGVIRDRYRVEDCGYDTPCWVWQLALGSHGYGREGQGLAHRAMWERKNGPIPDGMHLDHLCRNKVCVNPDHLEPVTQRENNRRSRSAILTVEQVREIREALARGEMHKVIAPRYGVAKTTIAGIAQGRNWRDVT